MDKKKVAFVLDLLGVGGVEKALIELLDAFDYEKYDVTLWLRNSSGVWTTKVNKKVQIKYWGIEDSRKVLQAQIKSMHFINAVQSLYFKMKCRYWKNQWDMNEYYATKSFPSLQDSYDCVIAYKAMSTAVIANVLYRLKSKKKILWVHGRNMRLPKLNKYWDGIYNQFDLIYCVSKKCQEDFRRDFPQSGQKSQVFYNLLNKNLIEIMSEESVDNLQYKKNEIVMVTVGRLESIKGQLLIPQVAKFLINDRYKIKWYLIGEGNLRSELEKEIEVLDMRDNVILLGNKENPYPYMKVCDIYVQTSYNEGFGLTVAEAKILQKPIVTTDAGVMTEQISNGENGIIVFENTAEALYEEIKTLLDNPPLQDYFVKNLKNEKYDASKEVQKLYDFIEY